MGIYGTPLQYACWLSKPDILDIILQYSPDVNKTGGVFHTAIQTAAYNKDYVESIILIKSLLSAGASTRTVGGKWGTALHASVVVPMFEVARMLLEHDVKKPHPEASDNLREVADSQGRLPLHIAAQSDYLEIINVVRPTGDDSDFERTDRQLRTPLHLAAATGAVAVIKTIRDVFQNNTSGFYELQDIDGWTPLHWALRQRNLEAVELLAQNEADLNRKCHRGWTPRHVAVLHHNEDMVERLMKKFLGAERPLPTDDRWSEGVSVTTKEPENPLHSWRWRWPGYVCDGCDCVSTISYLWDENFFANEDN